MQWFHNQQGQERAGPIKRDRDPENGPPTVGEIVQITPEGYQQRGGTLCRVQQAVIDRGILAAKQIATERWEQTVDFAPGKEGQAREDREPQRVCRKGEQQKDGDAFQRKGNEHGILASNMIGDPSEQGTRETIEDAIQL